MALPIGPCSRMANMVIGLINNLQEIGCKCRLQLGFQCFSNQS